MSNLAFPFDETFKRLTERDPFPWQQRLFDQMVHFEPPKSVRIPTGLGKTSVIAVWLIALINRPDKMPRRLVYVVNRRTVVDQTTAEVQLLRNKLPDLNVPTLTTLAISTLRGQFADNQEWSADPSRPAVICGTVDMIGSRLLFSGYRIGFKSRPLHAGLLGQDALLVHDEEHLEPAFQKLITKIENEQKRERKRGGDLPWPKLRVMALSATARNDNKNGQSEKSFELTPEERTPPEELPDPPTEPIHHVWRRLKAKKSLRLHDKVTGDKVAEQIAELALSHKDANVAVLIYVRTIDDVVKVCAKLTNKKDGVSLDQVQQLTGTMRGFERDRMADPRRLRGSRVFARFLKPPKDDALEGERWQIEPMPGTVYLVCTSAGEVGVNISADHMVCDLSTFESMAQRLGRVNRFGDGDARIDVVCPADFDEKDELASARSNTLKLLQHLPRLPQSDEEPGVIRHDASPKALGELSDRTDLPCGIGDAFSPPPTTLDATDILFDAWALTTIREPMPGRPPVAPYLHGLAEWQPFETHVAWREEVEVLESEELRETYTPADLLEDYPLKPHELLRDATDRKSSGVFAQLTKIAARHPNAPVWIIDSRDQINPTTLQEMIDAGSDVLHDATVLLPPRVGGLSKSGTLDGSADFDRDLKYDVADEWYEDDKRTVKRRVRVWDDEAPPEGMRLIRPTIDTKPDADEVESEEPIHRRLWHWYELPRGGDGEGSKWGNKPVPWRTHTADVVNKVTAIVGRLSLLNQLKQAVILAAELHDLGKKREQWQRSIGNPNPTDWYAKPGKPEDGPRWRPQYLGPYRHEFGSVLDVLDASKRHAEKLATLSPDMQDVVLHLIAAHHGRARPHFSMDEAYDPAGTQAEADRLACEVPRRFARLQRTYGRWGLAYLESLLRAADWAASAEPSEFVNEPREVSR